MNGFIGIYVRVSTEDQAEKGYSIPEQVRECKLKAQEISKDPVKDYIDDGYTGEVITRPALEKLLDDIKNGIVHTVICLTRDRLARNKTVYFWIKDFFLKYKINLVYVNMPIDDSIEGQYVDGVLALTADYQKKKILYDTARGRRSKARQGKVLRDFELYGFDYNKETCQLVPNEEAQIVHEIWQRFCVADHSLNRIAKDLTDRGVPTKRNKGVWHRQVIKQILEQPAYAGIFYANKWNTEGMGINKFRKNDADKVKIALRPKNEWIAIPCPAIIPKEWWSIAQDKLNNNRKRYAGVRGVNGYLCSRLLRCGVCSNTMNGTPSTDWGKKVYIYTCRKSYSGAKNPGCGRRIAIEKIDKPVWEQIANLISNPEAILSELENNNQQNDYEKELEQLEKDLDKVRKGKIRLLQLIVNGLEYSDIESTLLEQKSKEEKLTKRIEKVKDKMKEGTSILTRQKYYRDIIEQYMNLNLTNMSVQEKNKFARMLIREIVVKQEDIEVFFY